MVRYAGMFLVSLLCGSLSAPAALAAAAGEEIGASSLRSNRGVDVDPFSPTRSHLRVSSTARKNAAGAEEAPWWHDARKLQQAGSCPSSRLDSTNFNLDKTGQYGDDEGDCFYVHWDETRCTASRPCPLYIYVDGTENAADIDNRDSVFMEAMAARGYVAVTVDYADETGGYTSGCTGFDAKSKAIFDEAVVGSVLYQLCNDSTNDFGHGDVPVDCDLGVAVNGWSQGAHIALLAGNHNSKITAALAYGNGNSNRACLTGCFICVTTDVSCMNDGSLLLPKEKRRSIVGDNDSFFGACDSDPNEIYTQQQATSGYDCGDGIANNDCLQPNGAGYYVVPGAPHDFMDVSPASTFMNSNTKWGLDKNSDWLAATAQVGTRSPTASPTDSPTQQDTEAPELVSATSFGGVYVTARFSEKLDDSSVDSSDFEFSPSRAIVEVTVNANQRDVNLRLASAVPDASQGFTLSIVGSISDTSGNELSAGSKPVRRLDDFTADGVTKLMMGDIAPGSEQVQKVPNGDFEDDSSGSTAEPVSWSRFGDMFYDGTGDATITLHPPFGTNVARYHIDGGGSAGGYRQDISVTPDTDYVLSAFVWFLGNGTYTGTAEVDLNDRPYEPGHGTTGSMTLTQADTNATQGYFLFGLFNPGADTSVNLRIFMVRTGPNDGGWPQDPVGALWDNVAITPAASFVPPDFSIPLPGPSTPSPTTSPSKSPSSSPSKQPTASPSAPPFATPAPTASPSAGPTASPSVSPSASPSKNPTAIPTQSPSKSPTGSPVASTGSPSKGPSKSPTTSPVASTSSPSKSPTAGPTNSPSTPPSTSNGLDGYCSDGSGRCASGNLSQCACSRRRLQETKCCTGISPPQACTKNNECSGSSKCSASACPATADPTKSPSASPSTSPTSPPSTSPTNRPTAPATPSPTSSPSSSPTTSPSKPNWLAFVEPHAIADCAAFRKPGVADRPAHHESLHSTFEEPLGVTDRQPHPQSNAVANCSADQQPLCAGRMHLPVDRLSDHFALDPTHARADVRSESIADAGADGRTYFVANHAPLDATVDPSFEGSDKQSEPASDGRS